MFSGIISIDTWYSLIFVADEKSFGVSCTRELVFPIVPDNHYHTRGESQSVVHIMFTENLSYLCIFSLECPEHSLERGKFSYVSYMMCFGLASSPGLGASRRILSISYHSSASMSSVSKSGIFIKPSQSPSSFPSFRPTTPGSSF